MRVRCACDAGARSLLAELESEENILVSTSLQDEELERAPIFILLPLLNAQTTRELPHPTWNEVVGRARVRVLRTLCIVSIICVLVCTVPWPIRNVTVPTVWGGSIPLGQFLGLTLWILYLLTPYFVSKSVFLVSCLAVTSFALLYNGFMLLSLMMGNLVTVARSLVAMAGSLIAFAGSLVAMIGNLVVMVGEMFAMAG